MTFFTGTVLEYDNGNLRTVTLTIEDDDTSFQTGDATGQSVFVDAQPVSVDFARTGQGNIFHSSVNQGMATGASMVRLSDGRVLITSAPNFDAMLIASNPSGFILNSLPNGPHPLQYVSNQAGLNLDASTTNPGVPTSGDDLVRAGFLVETINGFGGLDRLILDYRGTGGPADLAAASLSLNLSTSASEQVTFSDGSFRGFNVVGFERYSVVGSNGNDSITGGSRADFLNGLNGNDVLRGEGGNDRLIGGLGNDQLLGGDGADEVIAGAGNDTITLAQSSSDNDADTAYGNDGNDVFLNADLLDTIHGGNGYDQVFFNLSSQVAGVDFDVGSNGNLIDVESVGGTFSRGDDDIRANFLVETVSGGSGVDRLIVDYRGTGGPANLAAASLSLNLSTSASEQVIFSDGSFRGFNVVGFERFSVVGSNGNDSVTGGGLADVIFGRNGSDVLRGEDGNDRIEGGNGNDRLIGGRGNDQLTGGGGIDAFVFSANDGSDFISDFSIGTDVIQFQGMGIDFDDLTISNASGAALVDYTTGVITVVGATAAQFSQDDFLFT